LAIALSAAFVLLLVVVARLGVIPIWWYAGGAIVSGAIVLALVIGLWRTQPREHAYRYTILTGLTVFGLVASLMAANLFNDFNRFFHEIQPGADDGTVAYDVVALKSHADGIESIEGETVGKLGADPNGGVAAAELAKLVTVDVVDLVDPGLLSDVLLSGAIDAMLVDHAYLSLFDENNPTFADQTKILHTLKITPVRPTAQPTWTPTPTASAAPAKSSFLVYISGIDQFGDIGTRGRSDVNILAAVNPTTGQVLLINTPRDYYVQLHGTTGLKDKLTHAGVYGTDMSIATLEDFYETHVDYYLRVNFTSVIQIVDIVGGVDVYSDFTFTSRYGQYNFVEGWNHLNGDQALGFARERYSFAAGDRTRGQNQEKVIAALIKKITEPSILLRYSAILNAVQGGIETSMPVAKITELANQQLSRGTDWQVESASVDGFDASEPTYSYGSQALYVMVPDMATVNAAKERLAAVLGG
jgi:LCP family protein required for cell wall assembly